MPLSGACHRRSQWGTRGAALHLKGSFQNGISLINDPDTCSNLNLQESEGAGSGCKKAGMACFLATSTFSATNCCHPCFKQGYPCCTTSDLCIRLSLHSTTHGQSRYTMLSASHAVRHQLIAAGFPLHRAPVVYPGARRICWPTPSQGRPLPEPLSGWIPLPERL